LFVDAARMPVYVAVQRDSVGAIWPLVLLATVGVVAGTAAGHRLLPHMPEKRFKQVVGVLIVILGIVVLFRRGA